MTITEIRRLRTATSKLSKWDSSRKVFGHVKHLKNRKADRLYEFYCLMRLIDSLRGNYDVSLVSGNRGNNHRAFPLSPAPKAGWSRFEITHLIDPKNRFQVCFGTNIKLSASPQTTIAPDISIQIFGASEDPDESAVKLVIDAKYKEDNSKSLDISIIREFAKIVDDLNVRGAASLSLDVINFHGVPGNCLITNGTVAPIHALYCRNNHIKQVGPFDNKGGVPIVAG